MGLDAALLRVMRTRLHQPPVERAVAAFSRLGEHSMVWFALSGAGALLDRPRRSEWIRAGTVVAVSYVANQAVKFAVRRPRPSMIDLPPLTATMSNRSYPSNHATTCGAAAIAYAELVPPALLVPFTVAMTLTRPYLGVHYPSDSLAGYALGVAVAQIAG